MKGILILLLVTLAFGAIYEPAKDMIRKINRMHSTWKAGHNFGPNPPEIGNLLGTFLDADIDDMVKEVEAINDLPENFDLREAYPQCEALKEIRDQANCGSCWAFGAAEVMSDRICIASKGNLQTRVSTQNLVTCCSSCGFGCNGGYPSSAFSFWSRGIPTGGLYGDKSTCQPYFLPPCDHHVEEGKYGPCPATTKTPKCVKTCIDGYPKPLEEDKSYGSSYSVRGEKQIMTEIYTKGSMEAAFTVYEDFLLYKTGVYQHIQGSYLGGHAIKVIGWGVENGTKYWLCVNSWNESWGDNGLFKILRGKNECGIEGQMVTGEPKL